MAEVAGRSLAGWSVVGQRWAGDGDDGGDDHDDDGGSGGGHHGCRGLAVVKGTAIESRDRGLMYEKVTVVGLNISKVEVAWGAISFLYLRNLKPPPISGDRNNSKK